MKYINILSKNNSKICDIYVLDHNEDEDLKSTTFEVLTNLFYQCVIIETIDNSKIFDTIWICFTSISDEQLFSKMCYFVHSKNIVAKGVLLESNSYFCWSVNNLSKPQCLAEKWIFIKVGDSIHYDQTAEKRNDKVHKYQTL